MIEEKLEKFFSLSHQKYSLKEMERKFQITSEETQSFYEALFQLEKDGKIYLDDEERYMKVPSEFYLSHGRLELSKKGNYYINLKKGSRIIISEKDRKDANVGDTVFVEKMETDNSHVKLSYGKVVRTAQLVKKKENDSYLSQGTICKNYKTNSYYIKSGKKVIQISKKDMNGAYPGDQVTVKVSGSSATILDILERKQEEHIFEYHDGTWVPIDTEKFHVNMKKEKKCYQEGERIVAKVSKRRVNDAFEIVPVRTLEKHHTINDQIEALALERGFSTSFPSKVLEEVRKLPKIITEEEIAKRKDLRNLITVTIDSRTAKDLDDAISLEKIDNIFRLYVHIADVSYYAKPGMALFDEAIKRATSVYLSNMVIPQFPEELSNHLCSLNPHEDKLTKTWMMDFNQNGELLDFSLFNSVINSNYKMEYEKVNALLEGTEIDYDYLPFYENLVCMNELSDILQNIRRKRGVTSFENEELVFDVDEAGFPVHIKARAKGPSQKMIESFMLAANEIQAEYAYWLDIPFVYRNHEGPSPSDIGQLMDQLKQCSHDLKRMRDLSDPKMLQRFFLSVCKNRDIEEIKHLSNVFFKFMKRAYYHEENRGHYGLALTRYGTFTSPIRRGADLLNHVFLGEVLEHGVGTELLEKMRASLPSICTHLSNQQIEAERLELDVNYMLLQKVLYSSINQEVGARIEFFMDHVMFLRTDQCIPGIVPLNKTFIYDRKNNIMIDRVHQLTYHIGEEVTAKVVSEKAKKQKIIFELCPKKEEKNKVYKKRREI